MTMEAALRFLPVIVAGYLLGSIPTGVIMARIFGWPDPLARDSGHTGAINAYRGGGIGALAAVLLLDILKGAGAVWLAGRLSDNPWALPLGGIAAVVGHNWSVWLGFRGGMGIATTVGAVITQAPLSVVSTGIAWLVFKPIIKHTPRTTIASCLTVPLALWLLGVDAPTYVLGVGTVGLVALRHLSDWNRVYEKKAGGIRRAANTEEDAP
jgi:glycerol-3-phosphate acyltransferase PlsY